MPAPLYPTDKEPCIPALFLDGHQEYLGWRELLLRAHEIEDLALPLPPAASAVLRLLIAIVARTTGLDDPEMGVGEWAARRRALLKEPDGFDADAIHGYFEKHTWDLFDPARPFLQDPRLAVQCKDRAGVNKLVFGRPEGNNLAWLSPHTDTDPQPVPSAQALWHLLIHHYYGASGTCSVRAIGDRRLGNATAGPLRSTLSFHPLGRTLYETLLAGLPKPADHWPDATDRCPWEEPELPDPLAPPPAVTWPGRLLTGRSCHALLLIPSADGRQVTDAYVTWATETKLLATDPFLIHHLDTNKPVNERHKPRRADADRALWRDLDALLLAGDETSTVQRPDAFTTLNDLPPDLRARLRVRVHGFDQEGRTNNRTWYTALTPPIWPWTQEHDPDTAERIAECRIAAEDIGTRLDEVSRQAWRTVTTPSTATHRSSRPPKRLPAWTKQARAAYWPRAETVFWRLLEHPDHNARAAFAAEAVAVLQDVTRPAITQHFLTARAVAAAVTELRRPPHPTPRRTS
ncbi:MULTISPECIES: type I-E CRISPR-associated protein Cse1/CasA [unclassified Streptomyces]|uniref:type I-E CRISPR-associated protein Cse1/CasA n=1 Tax=unclassified Streptomyces TaxID=2593676 RepID=UPI002E7FCC01|nr:type I-E CRISPR-associated protein Cse1/CasA [Streptomyces sp. NBC_00589]WTI33544.1 type I-E CRISPR-associated protein Cse1/CasA [Streptomyces sp. NBC_00775]WTI42383.1 type I-E CRISPR-associated protein Cse1/CasA [Streptomyces sp. NBC_00775]WUB23935.1 type I-E CRISPR-associated protein Cse1/CasA [Streptomyces sp. NBC_00589]WUB32784.1 type I-E CRISPR-associated protein Cse1/CasA [Streptomyces sp. NBC_00589]